MPITVVVGGQFGSEGKGKVAHYLAKEMKASVAIRCGGPNSGHTVIDPDGKPIIFQQLPTASILPDISIVLSAGMYIDLDILFKEINLAKLSPERLFIDPNAVIITSELKEAERKGGLINSIGSTGSGTGEALIQRIRRSEDILFAEKESTLSRYIKDTKSFLRNKLDTGKRVILEGTQGFGLSLLHSPFYPFVTSRDTTAAGFLSEAGLSPIDVDDVVMVIRAFPIRVSGNSGPLENETNWETITTKGSHLTPIIEKTSVSKQVRRVARFDSSIVKKAIIANQPTKIVLNHLDYICSRDVENYDKIIKNVIEKIEVSIKQNINYLGFGQKAIRKQIKKMKTEKSPNKDENTYSDKSNDSGMFSSTQIAYYIEKYGIIDNYDKSCYGSASYHMRIGGDVLTWDGGAKTEFILDEFEDRNKNKYNSLELKPNSLTFVTTIEKFNLTKDIICRFNLKSKWVHQGLLLGTGPIVDPQLNAYLLIPLHNFSSQTIRMNYGDELISVEFTKTLNPDANYTLPNGSPCEYIPNNNWNFDFKSYRKRIENKIIESSVLSNFYSIKSDIDSYKDTINNKIEKTEEVTKETTTKHEEALNSFRRLNYIGIIGTILAVTVLAITTWQLIENTHDKADAAYNLVKQYKYDNNLFDFRSFASKSSIDDIRKEIDTLKLEAEKIRFNLRQNNSKYDDITTLQDMLEGRLSKMEKEIKSEDIK